MSVPDPFDQFVADRVASRLFSHDLSVFCPPDAPADRSASIRQRLGWLTAPGGFSARVPDLANFAHDCWDEQIRRIYLLGMGGSSLGAEVLRDMGPEQPHAPKLTVLDTTDERTIREATETLSPANTLFVVASKSGGTAEVATLERHFWALVEDALGEKAGRQFVAITDPGTALVSLAKDRGYRQSFLNPPDIGGRYSVLSLFGLVPGALLRQPMDRLLESAETMATRCKRDGFGNPGLALAAFIAAHARNGRDKLTLLLEPSLESFGAWVEQLVAESTGKDGRGVLPIVGEPIGKPSEYGDDRAFVVVRRPWTTDLQEVGARMRTGGHPVFEIEMAADELGAELFRWEFATAVVGASLGINPFDEPNVKDAKLRTQSQLEYRHARAAFRFDPPFDRGQGYSRREAGRDAGITPGGYVAILDYLPQEPRRADIISRLRAALRERTHLATTYGLGPRYLHSTGQYHKGGPNTGMFLLFTAVDDTVTPVPGTDYTFSALKLAQALGDFDALAAAGRHVVHYHIEDPGADYSAALESVLRGYR
jgi:glucose-6-phosphate isomerase/transaldolase/glucose-6-phosphate isomerase